VCGGSIWQVLTTQVLTTEDTKVHEGKLPNLYLQLSKQVLTTEDTKVHEGTLQTFAQNAKERGTRM